MTHQCFWHGSVHAIHRHVIPVIGGPSKRKLRQIARTDDHTAALICKIHQYLGTLSRLSVFKSHIMIIHFLSDIPEMKRYRLADIDFHKLCTELIDKLTCIIICAVCCSETRHCNSHDLFAVKTEHIKGTDRHKKCQCGIQSSGYTHNSCLTMGMCQTFFKSHRLNR